MLLHELQVPLSSRPWPTLWCANVGAIVWTSKPGVSFLYQTHWVRFSHNPRETHKQRYSFCYLSTLYSPRVKLAVWFSVLGNFRRILLVRLKAAAFMQIKKCFWALFCNFTLSTSQSLLIILKKNESGTTSKLNQVYWLTLMLSLWSSI
jgi:hypothetical protein